MHTDTFASCKRWECAPATIRISLVPRTEDFLVDNSVTVIDFSLFGVGVLTTLALIP
jgi:hypothetical protein